IRMPPLVPKPSERLVELPCEAPCSLLVVLPALPESVPPSCDWLVSAPPLLLEPSLTLVPLALPVSVVLVVVVLLPSGLSVVGGLEPSRSVSALDGLSPSVGPGGGLEPPPPPPPPLPEIAIASAAAAVVALIAAVELAVTETSPSAVSQPPVAAADTL